MRPGRYGWATRQASPLAAAIRHSPIGLDLYATDTCSMVARMPRARSARSRPAGPATPGPATSAGREPSAARARQRPDGAAASRSRRPSTTTPAATSPQAKDHPISSWAKTGPVHARTPNRALHDRCLGLPQDLADLGRSRPALRAVRRLGDDALTGAHPRRQPGPALHRNPAEPVLDEVPRRKQALLISRPRSGSRPVGLEPSQSRRVKPGHRRTEGGGLAHRQRHDRLLISYQHGTHSGVLPPEITVRDRHFSQMV